MGLTGSPLELRAWMFLEGELLGFGCRVGQGDSIWKGLGTTAHRD